MTTMSEQRMAVLRLDREMLAAVLQLPEGAHVDHVWADGNRPGEVYLRVRGAGWPVQVGQTIPQCTGIVTTVACGAEGSGGARGSGESGGAGTSLSRSIQWGWDAPGGSGAIGKQGELP